MLHPQQHNVLLREIERLIEIGVLKEAMEETREGIKRKRRRRRKNDKDDNLKKG